MQTTNKDEQRLFDQVHTECCQCKMARRKIAEATRRIRCWFNNEFKAEEPLPKEFEQFYRPTEHDRIKDLWSKFL